MGSMQDWVKNLSPNLVGYASVAGIGVMALIVFRVARRIVQIGYFVLYFFIGFGIVYSASAYSTKSLAVPLSMPIIGGLAFAVVANAIRAKLMRIVSAVMLIALFTVGGRFWSQYTNSHKPGGDKSAEVENQRLAMQGLAAAKNDFDDIMRFLPKKDGKIAPGWISGETLQKAGVDSHLEKVKEEPAWHTWLTGLYKQETEDLGIWTSGGTSDQAKKSLTLRGRP
jgi:hypothetical protein